LYSGIAHDDLEAIAARTILGIQYICQLREGCVPLAQGWARQDGVAIGFVSQHYVATKIDGLLLHGPCDTVEKCPSIAARTARMLLFSGRMLEEVVHTGYEELTS
jgi:hypothetical protein